MQRENDLTNDNENYPLAQVKKDIGRIKDDFGKITISKNDLTASKSFLSNEMDESKPV